MPYSGYQFRDSSILRFEGCHEHVQSRALFTKVVGCCSKGFNSIAVWWCGSEPHCGAVVVAFVVAVSRESAHPSAAGC